MKAWYFGPERDKSVIKFVDVRYATNTATNSALEEFYTVSPGMTANNEPTTDRELSIDYSLIEFDDNWDYAEEITDLPDAIAVSTTDVTLDDGSITLDYFGL